MGIGESGSTIKMAEQGPGQVWCERCGRWVPADEYCNITDQCLDCKESGPYA